jgi:quercetin dioxygenase-like cupin family protein
MIGPNPQVRAANLYLFARFCLFVSSCFNVSGALVCAGTEIRQDVRPRTYRTRFLVFTINRNNLTHPGIWRIKASLKSALRMPLKGPAGQRYLASGVHVSMRLWEKEDPAEDKAETVREYETIGFVIEGKAELYIEGQRVLLEPGDSWVVPIGSRHRYKILAPFTAIEVNSPPGEVHARDT